MPNFGVGINEDVFLKNAQIDDKLWITITFEQLQEKEYNAFEALMNESEVVDQPTTTIDVKLFNPKVPKAKDNQGNDRTQEQIVKMIVGDLNKTKGILLHLMKGYLVKDDAKFTDLYRGTGIDANNFNSLIQQQNVLDVIQKNIAMDFINKMKPHFDDKSKLFRLLLLRQSKDKHFATFRDKYVEDNPFWEPMEITKDQSKVKFSAYEEKEGLNDGTPTAKSSADKPAADEAPKSVESVFGQ